MEEEGVEYLLEEEGARPGQVEAAGVDWITFFFFSGFLFVMGI